MRSLSKHAAYAALVLLAACSKHAQAPAAPQEHVACAIGAGVQFRNDCTVERPSPELIIVHHPDGGFRRFRVNGSELIPADGALDAVTTPAGSLVEVTVGDDRYRLPLVAPSHAPEQR